MTYVPNMNHICLNISKSISPSNYKGFGLYLQLQKSETKQSFGKWPSREINALKEALDFDEVVVVVGFWSSNKCWAYGMDSVCGFLDFDTRVGILFDWVWVIFCIFGFI